MIYEREASRECSSPQFLAAGFVFLPISMVLFWNQMTLHVWLYTQNNYETYWFGINFRFYVVLFLLSEKIDSCGSKTLKEWGI